MSHKRICDRCEQILTYEDLKQVIYQFQETFRIHFIVEFKENYHDDDDWVPGDFCKNCFKEVIKEFATQE